jgi:ribonuclease HII
MTKTPSKRRHQDHLIFASESYLLELSSGQTLFDASITENRKTQWSFVSLDEVGRGCLAGPVVVGATLWIESENTSDFDSWISSLRDSKKLSAQQREKIFAHVVNSQLLSEASLEPPVIKVTKTSLHAAKQGRQRHNDSESQLCEPAQVFKWNETDLKNQLASRNKQKHCSKFKPVQATIGFATADEIDRLGIVASLGRAASRALVQMQTPQENVHRIFFDGNRPLKLAQPWAQIPQILVTKGDDLLKSVSSSSVVAKVVRDHWMDAYGRQYPAYGWAENRGYGTDFHRKALEKSGPCPLHRRSFLSNICPE